MTVAADPSRAAQGATAAGPARVELVRVNKRYSNGTVALRDMSLAVGQGEFVWYETSTEAALAWKNHPPVDAAIIGIVDEVHVKP